MKLPAQVTVMVRGARTQWEKLSPREQFILLGLFIFLFSTATYLLGGQLSTAFSTQAAQLAEAELNLKRTTILLDKYGKLSAKRTSIQNRYLQLEVKEGEGARTLLDKLLRAKAGTTTNLSIVDGQRKAFTGEFERFPLTVKFQTADLTSLVNFLYEAIYGPRPLLVSRLEIQRNRAGDRLDVDLDVSSLQRIASDKRG